MLRSKCLRLWANAPLRGENMNELSKQKCEVCRAGARLVSREDMNRLKPLVPEWEIIETNGISRLKRAYFFKNFKEALDFANQVGLIAEQENHHPAILTEWGRVTVEWWTHKIEGLHRNDFIMAAKTDALMQ